MSTARWADRLGRGLLVVPARPGDPRGEGCLALRAGGARLGLGAAGLQQMCLAQSGCRPEVEVRLTPALRQGLRGTLGITW